MTSQNIISFLESRNWTLKGENQKFFGLLPPKDFVFEQEYVLYVPKVIDGKADADRYLQNLYVTLNGFYPDLSTSDLDSLLKEEKDVLKLRIYDKATLDGKISLNKFDSFMSGLKNILSDTATFVVTKGLGFAKTADEALRYLDACKFMQTQRGSFVVNIELPSKDLLTKETSLLVKEGALEQPLLVYSKTVNNKLLDVFDFVYNNIMPPGNEFTEDYIIENEALINIQLYQKLFNLLQKSEIKNIDISLINKNSERDIKGGKITGKKLKRLSEFIKKAKEYAFEVNEFTFIGKITYLSSKDPESDKNNVTMSAKHEGIPINVSAQLSSEHYKTAIEAHKHKLNATISGIAKKTQKKAEFKSVFSFEIND